MIFHHILPTILIMMLGAKAPNYDTYGLLRAAHFHNPPQYSYIVGYLSYYLKFFYMFQINKILGLNFLKSCAAVTWYPG